MIRHVVFSHGQESAPWGKKISAMAEVARAKGYEVHSVDYRGIPQPDVRVRKLIDFCKALKGELWLAGSSVGGYVSVAAALQLKVAGLFIIAPALYLPQLPPLQTPPLDCPISIVHGWLDDIVPWEDSVRFARNQGATLHLVQGDHLLHEQLPMILHLLERFLQRPG